VLPIELQRLKSLQLRVQHTASYSTLIETMCLSCTVFEL